MQGQTQNGKTVFVEIPNRDKTRPSAYVVARALSDAVYAVSDLSGFDRRGTAVLKPDIAQAVGLDIESAAKLLVPGCKAVRIYPVLTTEESST